MEPFPSARDQSHENPAPARATRSDSGVTAVDTDRGLVVFDHRAINGADGARFLASIREWLENPFRLRMR